MAQCRIGATLSLSVAHVDRRPLSLQGCLLPAVLNQDCGQNDEEEQDGADLRWSESVTIFVIQVTGYIFCLLNCGFLVLWDDDLGSLVQLQIHLGLTPLFKSKWYEIRCILLHHLRLISLHQEIMKSVSNGSQIRPKSDVTFWTLFIINMTKPQLKNKNKMNLELSNEPSEGLCEKWFGSKLDKVA